MNKKQLFGGALVAAGLCAAAQGQFSWGSMGSGNYVGAYSGGFIGFSIAGDWNQSAASGTAYALSAGDTNGTVQYADAGNTGLAYTIHFNPIPFTVSSATNATVSWDFSGDEGAGGVYIDSFIRVDGPNGNLAFADLNNPVGSTQISLVPGETYTFFGTFLAVNGGVTSGSVLVPAPASAALLGLAGLVGVRRRR